MNVWMFTPLFLLTLLTSLTKKLLNVPLQQKLQNNPVATTSAPNKIRHDNFAKEKKEMINSNKIGFLVALFQVGGKVKMLQLHT